MHSRVTGASFEQLAERHLRKERRLRRPEEAKVTSVGAEYTLRALRPEHAPGPFESQTAAEGLWLDRHGGAYWVECTGSEEHTSYRPGLRRTDSVRKIAGTMSSVLGVCHHWGVTPPRFVVITSHFPRERTGAVEYLRWGVEHLVGRDNLTIVLLHPNGEAVEAAIPRTTHYA